MLQNGRRDVDKKMYADAVKRVLIAAADEREHGLRPLSTTRRAELEKAGYVMLEAADLVKDAGNASAATRAHAAGCKA